MWVGQTGLKNGQKEVGLKEVGLKEVDLKGRGFSRGRPEPKKVRALALRAALNHSKEDE